MERRRIRFTGSGSAASAAAFDKARAKELVKDQMRVPESRIALGQTELAKAVEETKSLDHDRIAIYIHANTFSTVAGEIAFHDDGEWQQPRTVFTQFQDVQANNVEQFRDGSRQPILWPPEYKTGTMIYPYAEEKR